MTGRNVKRIGSDKTNGISSGLGRYPILASVDNISTVNNGQTDVGIFDTETKFTICSLIDAGKGVDISLAKRQHTNHDTILFSRSVDDRHRIEGLLNRKRLGKIKETVNTEGKGAAEGRITLRGLLQVKGNGGITAVGLDGERGGREVDN